MNKDTQAAVVFIHGQSNAHAHGQKLPEEDRITEPMTHVFSLDRDPNQSFDITDVVWSGFTTAGKNLGESQDHTASFAYHLAKLWQNAIDAGKTLPDLYIVQISIGSQGIINGMWNSDYPKVMVPGPLKTVKIALFPWAQQVTKLVMQNLERSGKHPEVIGWHWLGSEQEIWHEAYDRPDAVQRYDTFFDTLLAPLGDCPVYLYKVLFHVVCQEHGLPVYASDRINDHLMRQCARRKNTRMVTVEDCPDWDPTIPTRGVFAKDKGHYLGTTQSWFAKRFFDAVCKDI